MDRRALLLSGSSLLFAAGTALVTGAAFAQSMSGPDDVVANPSPASDALQDDASAGSGSAGQVQEPATGKPPRGTGGFCPVCGAPLPVARAAKGTDMCTAHSCHG